MAEFIVLVDIEELEDGGGAEARDQILYWFGRFAVRMGALKVDFAHLAGNSYAAEYAGRHYDPAVLVDLISRLSAAGRWDRTLDEMYELLISDQRDPKMCRMTLTVGPVETEEQRSVVVRHLKALAEGPPPLPRKPWTPSKTAGQALLHATPQRDPGTGLPSSIDLIVDRDATGKQIPILKWGPITTRTPHWARKAQETMRAEIARYLVTHGVTDAQKVADMVQEVTDASDKMWNLMIAASRRPRGA